jgi:hypothetical protein
MSVTDETREFVFNRAKLGQREVDLTIAYGIDAEVYAGETPAAKITGAIDQLGLRMFAIVAEAPVGTVLGEWEYDRNDDDGAYVMSLVRVESGYVELRDGQSPTIYSTRLRLHGSELEAFARLMLGGVS